jgi:hypothetical protein
MGVKADAAFGSAIDRSWARVRRAAVDPDHGAAMPDSLEADEIDSRRRGRLGQAIPTLAQIATTPDAPVIGTPTQGAAGGSLTATAVWTAPAVTDGSAITSYHVFAYDAAENQLQNVIVGSTVRSGSFTFTTTAPVQFDVIATNGVGDSPRSGRSASVVPR